MAGQLHGLYQTPRGLFGPPVKWPGCQWQRPKGVNLGQAALSGLSWQLGQPAGPRGECVGFKGGVGGSSSVGRASSYKWSFRVSFGTSPECFGVSGECGGSECLQLFNLKFGFRVKFKHLPLPPFD
nr:hypothetical protein [Mycoplasmoides pneumoniae]